MHTQSKSRKRWLLIALLTLVAALVLALPVMAGETISNETTVIAADEVIEDDLVWFGQSLTVNGVIEGDLVAFGQDITINGTVEGDLIAAGQSVIVNGEVLDDVYVGAYLLKLGEGATLDDELIVGAFSLEAGANSSIGGDLLFGGAQALLQGDVVGDVDGGGNDVQIDGSVGGDVNLGVGDPNEQVDFRSFIFAPGQPKTATVPSGLTVGDAAAIGGDLTYSSLGEGDVDSSAVAGSVVFDRSEVVVERPQFRPTRPGEFLAFVVGRTVLRLVRRFITLTLVGLLIVWLGPKLLTDTVQTFKERPWASLGIGALGYVVAIAALLILPLLLILASIVLGIVSLGGLTSAVLALGVLGWGGLLVGFLTSISWLAKIVLGLWLGQLIWQAIRPEGDAIIPPLLIGAALAATLTAVPILGGLAGFFIALFGLGAIILMLRARMSSSGEMAAV